MSNTSIGHGPAKGSNENHDGDPRNKTLGEKIAQTEAPAGISPDVADDATQDTSGTQPAQPPAQRSGL